MSSLSVERCPLWIACSVLAASLLLAAPDAGARPTNVQWMTPQPAGATAAFDSLDGGPDATTDGAPVDAMVDATEDDSGPGASDASGGHPFVPYQGGVVISQLKVVPVLWSARVHATVAAKIGGLFSTLTSGSFMHFVSEYGTRVQAVGSYGSVEATCTIAPIHDNPVLTDADIGAELGQQIATGTLPQADDQTVYIVYLPPGVNVNDPQVGASCVPSGFCGYHKSSGAIIYAVIPDFSQGGCAPGPVGCKNCCGDKSFFENLTMVSSHELMEAVTDPKPFDQPAWVNVLAGEIGDLCGYAKNGEAAYTTVIARDGAPYRAQKGWSNAAFLAHAGSPVGCVDYPTTLCCNDSQSDCAWLSNGSSACPNPTGDNPDARALTNGIVVTAPTVGGFGAATMALTGKTITSFNSFPLGITDWLTASEALISPTIHVAGNVEQHGGATACFAFVTNATQRGITQCAPFGLSNACNARNQHTESPASGKLCCTKLTAAESADGGELCASISQLMDPPAPSGVPASPPAAIAFCGIVLLAVGVAVARRPPGH